VCLEQVLEPCDRLVGDASEDIGQSGLRIDVVELGGLISLAHGKPARWAPATAKALPVANRRDNFARSLRIHSSSASAIGRPAAAARTGFICT
jgi:hypothetical protein